MTKKVFIIAPKEAYNFLSLYLEHIAYSYNFDLNDFIMPYDFKRKEYIEQEIILDAQSFLIESDEYIKNNYTVNNLSEDEIKNLRYREAIKRADKKWLKDKLKYSKKQIPQANLCLQIHNEKINDDTKKELRAETNMVKSLNINIFNIQQKEIPQLARKVMILKQLKNRK